jgi:hypothetical protein
MKIIAASLSRPPTNHVGISFVSASIAVHVRQVPPCRRLHRRYAVEQVDLLATVALLKPSPFGRHRWRLYRASHGHGPLPDSARERIWMRQNAAHSMMTAATSMPAGEDRTALTAHPC